LVQPREARQLVGILFKMSSDFFQQTPPKLISCLARRIAPRIGGRHAGDRGPIPLGSTKVY
jgi:hypothetical protein